MKVLVIGLGNILLSDEGIGVRVIEAMQARFDVPSDVELIDGGTSAMDLLDTMVGCDHMIIVDAVKTGRAPASVVRIAGDDVPAFFRTRISPHQVGLCDVLATLTLLDGSPETLTVIGCEPVSLATGLDLSPKVAAQVGPMIDMVLAELAGFGVRLPAR